MWVIAISNRHSVLCEQRVSSCFFPLTTPINAHWKCKRASVLARSIWKRQRRSFTLQDWNMIIGEDQRYPSRLSPLPPPCTVTVVYSQQVHTWLSTLYLHFFCFWLQRVDETWKLVVGNKKCQTHGLFQHESIRRKEICQCTEIRVVMLLSSILHWPQLSLISWRSLRGTALWACVMPELAEVEGWTFGDKKVFPGEWE